MIVPIEASTIAQSASQDVEGCLNRSLVLSLPRYAARNVEMLMQTQPRPKSAAMLSLRLVGI